MQLNREELLRAYKVS